MKRFFIFFFLSSIPLCAQRVVDSHAQVITSRIQHFMRSNGIPGVAVALYYKNKPYFYSFGFANPALRNPVTPDTIFEIGSITKSFTATVLALALNKNLVHLDDPISRFFPLLRIHNSPAGSITLAQLSTHTSGLSRTPPVPLNKRGKKLTRQVVTQALARWEFIYPPGMHAQYSNWGFAVLGIALENLLGKSYTQILREEIFEPLAMKSTFLRVPPYLEKYYAQGHTRTGVPGRRWFTNGMQAAGGLRSSARDMMHFLKANLGLKGPQWLIKAMQRAQEGLIERGPYSSQALSWNRQRQDGFTLISKNGGVIGFSTYIGFIPEKKIGIVFLSSRRNPHVTPFAKSLLNYLARSL